MQLPDFRTLEARLGHLTAGEIADIQRAFDFAVSAHAHQKREDGSPYVVHVIAVAEIVANWEADRDTIIAALLHDVLEDTTITKEEILTHFGRRVSLLVEGITKFTQADLSPDLPLDRKIETIRKLFDVMRLDMRSIVIKLADRLHNVLTIDSLPTPERRQRFAIETLTVYDKIAYHLGLRDVRRTFAAFCVPHAFPSGAEELRTRDRLCQENAQIPGMIAHELGRIGIGHVLSVSMQPRNLLIFHERIADKAGNVLIEDAFSVIVIVKSEDDCYRLLKSLHTLYRPVAGQFRDYIAAPSDAGYQSLHTVVTLQNGVVIEIRIRTPHMEEQVSRGITLWLFSPTAVLPPSFAWLKRSAAIDLETRDSSGAFWEALESDVLSETISVTVDRKRISLPRGATALDAAYAEHNAGAGKLLSITIGGRPVAFGEVLTEDNVLHLSFGPHERVAFDWLQMVATKHARTHIVDVLKRTSRYEKIALGAAILQKELDHYNKGLVQELSKSQTQHVAEHFRRQSFDDVLSMVGEGVVRARDVVFYLFPEHRKSLLTLPSGARYAFRLHVTGRLAKQQDAQAHVSGIARLSDTAIHRTNVSFQPSSGRVDIVLSGSADDRLQFADFVDLLERQEWTSSVQTIISLKQKAFLFIAFAFAFSVTLLDIIFFPEYQQLVTGLPFGLRFLVQSLPLFPILIANYYLLRLLRHYIARMRSDRWFLGIALVLNLVGLMVLVLRIVTLGFAQESLLPLVAVFALSLLYMAYMFFQTDALLAPFDERLLHVIPQSELSSLKRKKYTGYGIRLLAVLIWGLEPIYIRYTPVNDLSPFLRTFLLGVGVLIPSLCIFVVRHYLRERRMPKFAMPYDPIFLILVIGQIGYMYFKNASLIYTSGTNLLLFNNFAPLLGLIIAAFVWRRDIPYFRHPRTMLWIFLLAMTAGIGSSLLVYSSAIGTMGHTVTGDVLAMISTFFDVLMTIGQIEYIKHFPRTNGTLLNLHIFLLLLMCTAPVIVLGWLLGWPLFTALTPTTLLLGLGIGLFVGFGQLLNYEAFKRIDGYLAYMMFNISVLITFVLEAFVVHSIQPTSFLLLSGILIIFASVMAEYINSRCQKKGM